MTAKELIEKLNKFNPDGNMEVVNHFECGERYCIDDISYISIEEDINGNLVIVLNTIARQTEISKTTCFSNINMI